MMLNPRILIVDDEAKMRRILELMLSPDGYAIDQAEDGAQALALIEQTDYDLVITDLMMPNLDGMEMLRRIRKTNADTPIIVITAFGSVESSVEAMKNGAFDYITKPFEKEMIRVVVSKAVVYATMRRENAYLREEAGRRHGPHKLVGNSEAMRRVYELTGQVAPTGSTVLITGESGTGKELLARAIHYHSPRAGGPFIAVNCAAIPDTLLESELFGFEKGAFTGADRAKQGKFELAHKGSLFLDEIAEMSPAIQAKLLRVLQEKSFERLGSVKTVEVDIRLIVATNKNLAALTEKGQFRQDLFYRLNVFPLNLPPLRERKADIPLLAAHFVERFGSEMRKTLPVLTDKALALLQSYAWPGNVRELQNVIERAMILCRGGEITPEEINLPGSPADGGLLGKVKALIPPSGVSLDEIEKTFLVAALDITGNNQVQAARLLNLTRNTLCYRLKKYGIKSTDDPND